MALLASAAGFLIEKAPTVREEILLFWEVLKVTSQRPDTEKTEKRFAMHTSFDRLSNTVATLRRREFLATCALVAASLPASAFTHGFWNKEPEKKTVTIAVGGRHLYYYLPMALADWLGFYKKEGLNVRIFDTIGGSQTRRAVLAGTADVASGAFEHTVISQARGLNLTAFVLQGRTPQCVFSMNRGTMGDVTDLKELVGRRVGVTSPGSSSHVFANLVMKRAGVEPTEFFPVGIGAEGQALNAVRNNEVDAFVGLDPVVAQLQRENRITVVADSCTAEKSDALYGGPMVGGCLYAPNFFVEHYPETVQRLTNAILRALGVINRLSTEEILSIAPEAAKMGVPELYARGFAINRPTLMHDGRFPRGCVETVAHAMAMVNAQYADFHPKEELCYTNRFVDAASSRV